MFIKSILDSGNISKLLIIVPLSVISIIFWRIIAIEEKVERNLRGNLQNKGQKHFTSLLNEHREAYLVPRIRLISSFLFIIGGWLLVSY